MSHDDKSFMNINNTTRTVDNLEDMERVLEQNLTKQDKEQNERTSEGGNKTINNIESNFPDTINNSITNELVRKDVFPGSSVNPNTTFEQESTNITIEESSHLPKELLTGSSENQNVTFDQETADVNTEFSTEYMSPVSKKDFGVPNIRIQEATPEHKSRHEMTQQDLNNESSNSAIVDIGIMIKKEVDQQEEKEFAVDNDMRSQFQVSPTRGLKHPFTRVDDISFGHQSPPSCTDVEMKEVIMREIQSEIEEEFKMAELNEAPHDKTLTDEHGSNFESSNMQMFTNRDSLANMFNNTFEQERVPEDVSLNQGSSTMSSLVDSKRKQINFMDAIDNNFAVEFKVPTLPQSRKSGDMMSNVNGLDVFAGPKVQIDVKDEVFKSAGSTCKKKCFFLLLYFFILTHGVIWLWGLVKMALGNVA